MYTKKQEYQKATKERKIELIEIDAYSLMIKYLVEKIDLIFFQDQITELAELGFYNEEELIEFVESSIAYEAFQYSHGKNEAKRSKIRNRVKKFKGS